MSKLFNIGYGDEPVSYGQYLQIDIRVEAEDGIGYADLSDVDLIWRLARDADGRYVYITKTTADGGIEKVAHPDDTGGKKSIARITIRVQDWETVPGPGFSRHELRDTSAGVPLCYGDVKVTAGMPPVEGEE